MDSKEYFTNDWNPKQLYNEYILNYKKLKKHVTNIRRKYKKTKDPEKIKYRKMLYDTETEMIEKIIALEKYLPYNERKFTRKNENKLTLQKDDFIFFDKKFIENNKYNPEMIVNNEFFTRELKHLISKILTERQYKCIILYFWYGLNQDAIAQKLKITQQQVSKFLIKGLKKIRESDIFRDVLEDN